MWQSQIPYVSTYNNRALAQMALPVKKLNFFAHKIMDHGICHDKTTAYGPRTKALLLTTIIVLSILCNGGCAGNRIECDSPDANLVGKVIHFSEPMAYIVFSNKAAAKEYGFCYARIDGKVAERELVTKYDANSPFGLLYKYPNKEIRDGMAFTILGTCWVRHGWIGREFSSDFQVIILQDENNILSACSMSKIMKRLGL